MSVGPDTANFFKGIEARVATGIEVSLFTKSDGVCTKRISLANGEVISDASACAISMGNASRVRVDDLEGDTTLQAIATLLRDLRSNTALCLGRLVESVCDHPRVVTERRRKQRPAPDLIARTQLFLKFASDEPALMLLDFDRKGIPPEIMERIDRLGSALNLLIDAFPILGHAGRISRASTSAGIYNTETGQQFPGSGGEHHYMLVMDGSDIPRALSDMHDRLWLSGLGWYLVGSAGQLLERSIVDKSVGSSERLVFEGAPVVVAPLAQDQSLRQPVVVEGEIIDTRSLIPPLTAAERDIVKSLKEAARRRLKPEAKRVRAQSDRILAEQIVSNTGIPLSAALRHAEARHEGDLMPSTILVFDDSEIGSATVGDILDDPNRFVGETLADPLEGVAYGRCKAKVMVTEDGAPIIHSFAHGRTIYHLVLDSARLKKQIEAAVPSSAVDVFIAGLSRARLDSEELTQLRNYVSERSDVGVRDIDNRIKAANEVRARKEAERAAAATPLDDRITFSVPPKDAEMTVVMERIDKVLCQVKEAEPPMRNADGVFSEIRTRAAMGLHLLVPQRDQAIRPKDLLPAPDEPLISVLDVDATTIAIERHIRHTRLSNPNVSVRLPFPFAHAYGSYASSALPRISGVVTAPLVTEMGLLATSGLHRDLGLVFRIDPLLVRLVPEAGSVSYTEAHDAYRFLKDEWLCDVQTTEEGKAIILVSALTLIERVLLPERPAFVITAGQRGGGKTTLTNMISLAVLGRHASAASWSENVEERRKALFAHLREGPAMIAWDNLPRGAMISCPVIEKSLTSTTITDRILGLSEQATVPATTIHYFTGNNILPAGDMASRSYTIRLHVDRPDPENRKFKHPDPFAWTIEHRGRILRALYTLLVWNPLLAMEANKRPQPKTRFKRWWTLCASPIQQFSPVELAELLRAAENEGAEISGMAILLRGLWGTYGNNEFTAAQLAHLAHNLSGSPAKAAWELPVLEAIEEATNKPFPPNTLLDARKTGKRLQMIVGRPVAVDDALRTLQNTPTRRGAIVIASYRKTPGESRECGECCGPVDAIP
jgi:hypothetical protein